METPNDGYKWQALSITTMGVLMATIDGTIMLIALPDIFRGIHLNPLLPGNSFYLLWMILSFLVVTSVLVVSLGRLGDMYGRSRMYNLGFAVFTFFSLLLSVTWMNGSSAAIFLIVVRVFQGVGAALLLANSSAILTDAFPVHQRGLALGINQAAAISGTFIGLILGGVLAPINWRLIFLVSVPIGLFGTIWGYIKLRELSQHRKAQVDWAGNITFALGLILVMIGITYGIEPYGKQTMGWENPRVIAELVGGNFAAGGVRHHRNQGRRADVPAAPVQDPSLHRRHPGQLRVGRRSRWAHVHAHHLAPGRLAAAARLRLHPHPAVGRDLHDPADGRVPHRRAHLGNPERPVRGSTLRHRRDARSALGFVLLELLPINFPYWAFGLLLLWMGLTMGAFGAPNRLGVMNSLPPEDRGAGAGMNTTFQNSAQVLSIGIFFSLMIAGLSSGLPESLYHGLVSQGVPQAAADKVAHLPPVSTLFAAFLGLNPVQNLLGPQVLGHVSQAHAHVLTGRSFFPSLIAGPFKQGLHAAFDFAIVACLIGAATSWSRGKRYVHGTAPEAVDGVEGDTVEGGPWRARRRKRPRSWCRRPVWSPPRRAPDERRRPHDAGRGVDAADRRGGQGHGTDDPDPSVLGTAGPARPQQPPGERGTAVHLGGHRAGGPDP